MFIPGDRRLRGALLLLALFLTPLFGEAQVTEPDAHATANHLHAVAMTAATFVDHQEALPMVARLHARSAELRDADDPHAFECWRLQAALLHGIGEYEEALGYLEAAAELALRRGLPALAAHTYLDAAGVLSDQGRKDEAQLLIARAHRLTTSDLLTVTEQRRIQQRIQVR